MIKPNRQADSTPPDDTNHTGEHVGEHVKALAKLSSDSVDTKLETKVSMDALIQLASVA